MDNKQWSLVLAILSGAIICLGGIIGLSNYQIGYNFTMLATPVALIAIWYEIRK